MSNFHKVKPSLDRLQVLEMLLRTRSPSAAAREIGVTQSAVSKVLAQLRTEMGDPLLVRRGDRMILTPRAERLVKPLSVSLGALRKVLDSDVTVSRPASVSISMRDQFVVALAPVILRRLAQESPETRLNIVAYERDRLADDLARGAIDVAVSVDPQSTPGLMGTLLYQESFVCLTPHKDAPTLREYLAARHVATTSHSGYVGIDAALEKKGLARRIVAHIPYFAALIQVAEVEGLYATVPRRVALAIPAKNLFVHPVPITIPRFHVTLVWDRRCDQDSANRWLRGLVLDAARTATQRHKP